MLKIKDNVDLKELEKYGFIVSKYKIDKYKFNTKKVKALFDDNEWFCLTISDKKTIDLDDYIDNNACIDILYDLIKDDLVEKVKE